MQLKMLEVCGFFGGRLHVCIWFGFFSFSFQLFLLHYMIDRKSSLVVTRDKENCYQQVLSLGQEVKNEI